MTTAVRNKLNYISTIHLLGEPVDVLVTFEVQKDGKARINKNVCRLDNGNIFPSHHWKEKFRAEAAHIIDRLVSNLESQRNQKVA